MQKKVIVSMNNWKEIVVRNNGRKFLVVVMDDAEGNPNFDAKIWDISGYRKINSFEDLCDECAKDYGPDLKSHIQMIDYEGTEQYPTIEQAEKEAYGIIGEAN